jgi:hypothetical protein
MANNFINATDLTGSNSTPSGSTINVKSSVKKQSKASNSLPPILGMPLIPTESASSSLFYNSLVVAEIIPCKPKFTPGYTLFELENKMKEYIEKLSGYNYTMSPSQRGVLVCFQADNLPSENFSNEFGESFLSSGANVVSQGAQELVQLTGKTNLTEALRAGGKATGTGIIGSALNTAANMAEGLRNGINGMSSGMGTMVDALLGGARVDFPMVWKNSAYTTNYSFTIKLYNPSPGNDKANDYFIVGPLTALLVLALPQVATDSVTHKNLNLPMYNYPYFCQIDCKGLFKLEKAIITGVSVNKGVDNSAAFNQRSGCVEVKIEVVNLYQHLVESNSSSLAMPTLKTYIDNLRDKEDVLSIYTQNSNQSTSISATDLTGSVDSTISSTNSPDFTSPPTSRVDPDKQKTNEWLDQNYPLSSKSSAPTTTANNSLTPSEPAIVNQMPTSVQNSQVTKADNSSAKSPAVQSAMNNRMSNLQALANSGRVNP